MTSQLCPPTSGKETHPPIPEFYKGPTAEGGDICKVGIHAEGCAISLYWVSGGFTSTLS